MAFLKTLILLVNIISAVTVVILVLMQHGKGADAGPAALGSSAGGLFGASGSANFLSRTTAVCATVFFITCLTLVLLTTPSQSSSISVMDAQKTEPQRQSSKKNPAKQDSKIPE